MLAVAGIWALAARTTDRGGQQVAATAASPRREPAPPAPAPLAPVQAPGPAPAAAASNGRLLIGDSQILPPAGAGGIAALPAGTFRGEGLRVQSVFDDRHFWVGSSATERVLVWIVNPNLARPEPGACVNLSGFAMENFPGYAEYVGFTDPATIDLITRQARHLHAQELRSC